MSNRFHEEFEKKKSFEQKSLLKKSLMNVYLALLPVSSFKNLKNM